MCVWGWGICVCDCISVGACVCMCLCVIVWVSVGMQCVGGRSVTKQVPSPFLFCYDYIPILCLTQSLSQELKAQLDTALGEVKDLQESRERQTEIVKSIVNQRDMYRTLLAQSTPLPPDTSMSTQQMSELQGDDSVTTDSAARRQSEDSEMAKEFKELKEQFEAYRKEKVANDEMLRTQVEETREQCSSLRMDNAKLSSKVRSSSSL